MESNIHCFRKKESFFYVVVISGRFNRRDSYQEELRKAEGTQKNKEKWLPSSQKFSSFEWKT
jgi:hypothetical protein